MEANKAKCLDDASVLDSVLYVYFFHFYLVKS